MYMEFKPLPLEGACLINLPKFTDDRGIFVKTFNDALFKQNGIQFELKESYYSFSKKNVIRGMHFQLPPHDHAKVVYCPQGAILDVIVDLRKDAATFGQFFAQVLSAENHLAYYIPKGFAHGFMTLTDDAMTYYLVSSGYHQQSDTGILWDSFGFDWQCAAPIISSRDQSFPSLAAFQSPF
jgi:dTDP-4-dehydrorhamnose 3,5-epimerase